jgi:two-component system chemotaxis response regulator CheY
MAKILIIEDEKFLRETLTELLSFSGYVVHQSDNGLEGLKAVEKIEPDLILCDIMMPVLDGYGFLELHQKSDYSHIPVFFLTAETDYMQKQKGMALGAKKIINKPFVYKELKNIIEIQLLSLKRGK